MNNFETVIGLEVHLQFNTQTKIFCGCANIFGEEPNTKTCPVCLGLPGTLPVLNEKVLQYALKVAASLNCTVNTYIKFDRKNYYYPDLPKNFQISQYDFPIGKEGFLIVRTSGGEKKVGITRAHLEEDAGKLIHDTSLKGSLVDYNRTGTPLMEIVSEPDIRSAQEAYDYLTALKLKLHYLDVSDCDMEKGSLRCDANISIRKKGDKKLGVKTELKNMNSFKAVKAALEFEEGRQKQVLDSGKTLKQETRLWNEDKAVTVSMRIKEEAHDYRYFPEPDLVPFIVKDATIEEIKSSLPEMPLQKLDRLMKKYSLPEYDTAIIIQDKNLADFFEQCAQIYKNYKKICNWIIGPLQQELNTRKLSIEGMSLNPKNFVALIEKVEDGTISNLAGKDVLKLVIETGNAPDEIIKKKGLEQVSDESALEKIIDDVFSENKNVVAQVKEGKESAVGFLIGQSMRKSKGKANPKKIGEIIKKKIKSA